MKLHARRKMLLTTETRVVANSRNTCSVIVVCVRRSSTFVTKDHYIFYHVLYVRGTQ